MLIPPLRTQKSPEMHASVEEHCMRHCWSESHTWPLWQVAPEPHALSAANSQGGVPQPMESPMVASFAEIGRPFQCRWTDRNRSLLGHPVRPRLRPDPLCTTLPPQVCRTERSRGPSVTRGSPGDAGLALRASRVVSLTKSGSSERRQLTLRKRRLPERNEDPVDAPNGR